MHIELKNVKISGFASEETLCFEAAVYVDGKKAFLVKNDGHGGCNDYVPNGAEGRVILQKAVEYASSVLSKSFVGMPQWVIFDVYIEDLLEKHQMKQRARRLCKNCTIFRTPEMPEDQYLKIKLPFNEQVRARVVARHGNTVEFLNDLL